MQGHILMSETTLEFSFLDVFSDSGASNAVESFASNQQCKASYAENVVTKRISY